MCERERGEREGGEREREREREREKERLSLFVCINLNVLYTCLREPIPLPSFQVPLHLVSPSSLYPPINGDLLELGRLLISRDSTVEDLKLMILTLPFVSLHCYHYNVIALWLMFPCAIVQYCTAEIFAGQKFHPTKLCQYYRNIKIETKFSLDD